MVAPAGKESWAWAGLPLNAYFARYVDVMEVMVMVLTEEEDALCRDLGGIDLDPCGQQLSLPVYRPILRVRYVCGILCSLGCQVKTKESMRSLLEPQVL